MSDAPAIAVLETKIAALDRRVDDANSARDKALGVALLSLDKHLAVMNEFRGAMADQAAKFIMRIEVEALSKQISAIELNARDLAPRTEMRTLESRVETNEKAQITMQARYAMMVAAFAVVVTLANLLAVWWPHIFKGA